MKRLKKWGLPLLTGIVVLAAVLLPERISELRDRQILNTAHTEPIAQADLNACAPTLPEKLELLGRAIRYPELDIYSATQPLADVDQQAWSRAEKFFLQGAEYLAAWGVLPEEFDRTALSFQGGSRAAYLRSADGLSVSILYLQGRTGNQDDLWMAVDEETGLPVWIDGTLRSVKISLDTVEVGRAFWNGLGLEVTQRGPSVWEVEGAGGLVYVASLERHSGRICVEPLGFTWDLFSEEADTGAVKK